MVLASKSSIWEVEAGRSGVQGPSQLHSKSEARPGCITPCLKQIKTKSEWREHSRQPSRPVCVRGVKRSCVDTEGQLAGVNSS